MDVRYDMLCLLPCLFSNKSETLLLSRRKHGPLLREKLEPNVKTPISECSPGGHFVATTMSPAAPPFAQPHIVPSVKRVRVLFGGKYVVDTRQANLMYVISNLIVRRVQ